MPAKNAESRRAAALWLVIGKENRPADFCGFCAKRKIAIPKNGEAKTQKPLGQFARGLVPMVYKIDFYADENLKNKSASTREMRVEALDWLGRKDLNPRNGGVRVRCLTTWRRPSNLTNDIIPHISALVKRFLESFLVFSKKTAVAFIF